MPIRVGGLTYWQIKQKALNGSRAKLTADQLGFVGFVSDTSPVANEDDHEDRDPRERADTARTWVPAAASRRLDEQLEELAKLRDTMPGWFALARKIVEDD